MNSEETITDIVAEMRDLAARHTFGQEVDDALAAIPIDDYADRIEAAAKRERVKARRDAEIEWSRIGYEERKAEERPGNAAATREALEGIIENLSTRIELRGGNRVTMPVGEAKCLVGYARAAIAAPARNCDVGTAEEQRRRFDEFCEGRLCAECPFTDAGGDCPIEWANTTAQEGVDHA